MWLNEMEIDEAVRRFDGVELLGAAAKVLQSFKDEVNAHSDGWPYWTPAGHAARQLMQLLHAQMWAGMGAYPRVQPPTLDEVRKAIAPMKGFMTRRGNAAGMKVDFTL